MQADEAAEELSGVYDNPTAWLPVGQKGRCTQNTGKRIFVCGKFGLVLPDTRFGLDLQLTPTMILAWTGNMSWQSVMKTENGAAYHSQLALPAKQQTYMVMPLPGLLVPSFLS
jgi:hypothetical protein